MLVSELEAGGYAVSGADVPRNLSQVVPVVIQCFEPETLRVLHNNTDLPLVLLTGVYNQKLLEDAAGYAQGVGPEKSLLVPPVPAGESLLAKSLELVGQAHALGLALHPWTFRVDSAIDPAFNGDFDAEQVRVSPFDRCCL
jgi:glycerophosphoryl diester phosphodiesterase